MPITKQAIKKMRRDRALALRHRSIRETLKTVVKAGRRRSGAKTLSTAYKALDKAVKQHVVHKNKAARLKSRLARLLKKK